MLQTVNNLSSSRANLFHSIKGYMGYEEQSKRKISDKHLRSYLVKNIKSLQELLNRIPNIPNQEVKNDFKSFYKNTSRKLDTISQSLSKPTYGMSFFIKKDIPGDVHNCLYDYEWSMLTDLKTLFDEFNQLSQNQDNSVDYEERFVQIQDSIDNLNQDLFEREALILGEENKF
jgi:hypothetical protein